ncbi:MAG: zinc ribbon domain-containing protein [Chitinivibrionia bacterium]|nr:zinc ribbon domain-containing protein [Chitinivibrionia bacterium]
MPFSKFKVAAIAVLLSIGICFASVFCMNCGTQLLTGTNFCGQCGTAVDKFSTLQQVPPELHMLQNQTNERQNDNVRVVLHKEKNDVNNDYDNRAMRVMLSHIEQGRSFLVGVAERRSADSINIIVRHFERIDGDGVTKTTSLTFTGVRTSSANLSVDVLEFYINDNLSFFLVNNNWVSGGSSGTFDGKGLIRELFKRNVRREVRKFFSNINFYRQASNVPTRVI